MRVKLMGSLAGILVMRLEARLQLCKLTLFISRNTASGTWVSWHSLRSRWPRGRDHYLNYRGARHHQLF